MLNEAATLPELLAHLLPFQRHGCEVLLVDGGSVDGGPVLACAAGFRVLRAESGRARQMNAGARVACGEVLLFLHADTRLPAGACAAIGLGLGGAARAWGRFDVTIAGRSRGLGLVAFCMNLRSRWSGIATGDQAIFVTRAAFDACGGFPEQALMEDIELSRRLKRLAAPVCLRQRVVTSGRRWDTAGLWPTILLMWRLRFAYWRGASPERLAAEYK
jgi:rSAM/selenodomain-associated transferase 2